jgi:hypothetical protein
MAGLAEAFAHFRVVSRDRRRSWSARSADGGTVVLTLWSDRFRWKDRPLTYDGSEADKNYLLGQYGGRERLEICSGPGRIAMDYSAL